MKTRSFVFALLLSPCLPLLAQELKPIAMLGTWRITAQHPSGVAVTSTMTFTQNLKFTSSTTANDKALMDAAGTWTLEGRRLQWKYERSSHPSIAPGYTDTDEVLGITETKLTLKSGTSGKVQEWQRVR